MLKKATLSLPKPREIPVRKHQVHTMKTKVIPRKAKHPVTVFHE
jgi:hypothetical protein